jgi:cell wall-associated NlpC family hydrolase
MKAGFGAGKHACAPALVALALIAVAGTLAASAQAAPGGVAADSKRVEVPPPLEPPPTTSPPSGSRHSTLLGSRAVAPAGAPEVVKQVITAANRIRTTPYIWGGGHRGWSARGYDCSGAVSFALHGGGLLRSPLVSGSFMGWGAPGPGRWITVYANGGHVYAEIAGLRWDTSGNTHGTGPRWHTSPPYPAGFAVRHPIGY